MIDMLFDDLSQEFLIRLNKTCDKFEREWSSSSIDRLATIVQSFEPQYRDVVAVELIGLDVELRQAQRLEVSTETYTTLFPALEPPLVAQITKNADEIELSAEPTADSRQEKQPTQLTAIRQQLIDAEICTDSEVTQLWQSRRSEDATQIVHALRDDSRITSFQADVLNGNASGPLKLGEYTLLEQLGAGGMGRAYRAFHRRMHRVVAIKLLHSDLQADARFRTLFEREVIATAQLAHPNIVTAFDAGEADGMLYLVTEYVPARDLGRILKEDGPLSVEDAVSVIQQAATALEYAHSKGIIHRDVKPGNLLRDEQGTVKLLDLGLSRLAPELTPSATADGLSSAQFVMGTAAYMSPEQAAGDRNTDGRSDIYSLGCTLFTLLTNRACYPADTPVASVFAHRSEPIPSLAKTRTDVPAALDTVFRKMVAKHPGDRFADMTEVLHEIHAAQQENTRRFGRSESATHQSQRDRGNKDWIERAKETLSRTPIIAFTLGATALIAGVGYFIVWGDDRIDRPDLQTPMTTTQPQPDVKLNPSSPTPTQQPGTPPLAKSPFDSDHARDLQEQWAKHLGVTVEYQDKATGLNFVLIPPGEFMMGSTDREVATTLSTIPYADQAELLCIESESPKRRVEIPRAFYLSSTEVTFESYRRFANVSGYKTVAEQDPNIGYGYVDRRWTQNGGHYHYRDFGDVRPTPRHPVANLTKADTQAFCEHYSYPLKGVRYRLPTESEWEYACRAGTDTTWYFGNDDIRIREFAVITRSSPTAVNVAARVGSLRPNAFGLYDMHGNVAEWCEDIFDWRTEERYNEIISLFEHYSPKQNIGVVRGGSVTSPAGYTRSARRRAAGIANFPASFRVVLEIDQLATEAQK